MPGDRGEPSPEVQREAIVSQNIAMLEESLKDQKGRTLGGNVELAGVKFTREGQESKMVIYLDNRTGEFKHIGKNDESEAWLEEDQENHRAVGFLVAGSAKSEMYSDEKLYTNQLMLDHSVLGATSELSDEAEKALIESKMRHNVKKANTMIDLRVAIATADEGELTASDGTALGVDEQNNAIEAYVKAVRDGRSEIQENNMLITSSFGIRDRVNEILRSEQ